jgi:BASS family bile acid:Na+ symporter
MDVLKASIMLLVLSQGMRASTGNAIEVLRKPALLARSLLAMVIVMPLVAILFAKVFHLKTPIEITLLALSLSPMPPILPKWLRKPGLTEEYAIGLMVVAAFAALILIPLSMAMLGRIFSAQVSMPARAIVPILLATVLIPLALGLVFHRISPRISERASRYAGLLGTLLLWAGFIPLLFAMHKPLFTLLGNGTLLAFVAFSALGVLVGQWIGGPLPEHRSVLSTFTAMRHPAVAIAILQQNFPDETLVVPAVLLYLLVSIIIATLFVGRAKPSGAGRTRPIPERGGEGLKPA